MGKGREVGKWAFGMEQCYEKTSERYLARNRTYVSIELYGDLLDYYGDTSDASDSNV